jgi:hypothetical protein
MDEKVQGPKSYFPSIEKNCGQPIEHWMNLLDAHARELKHIDQVTFLKENHSFGHGHANALVAVFRQERGL